MFLEIAIFTGFLVVGGKVIYNKNRRDNLLRLKAEDAERKSKLLDNISVTVFVRESNGSRTDLEHYLEQELINRGARLLLANQESGTALIKRGEYASLNVESHLALVGTLIIKDGGNKEIKIYTEDVHSFNLRKAKWEQEWQYWDLYLRPYAYKKSPEPQLRGREYKIELVPCLLYQFSYRVLGRDGAILASGSEQENPQKNQVSFDSELKALAQRSVETLDGKDIWQDIVI